MKQETLEEAAENFAIDKQNDKTSLYYIALESFKDGAKWQQERSYSDMQEYATFCIECDRKEMPLLLVQDWFEQFKNKERL
jgi:hypothetical protein